MKMRSRDILLHCESWRRENRTYPAAEVSPEEEDEDEDKGNCADSGTIGETEAPADKDDEVAVVVGIEDRCEDDKEDDVM